MTRPRNRMQYPEAARKLLRETLFDAASDLIAQRSWAETRMADVAEAAGVSRQTLYNEFGSRQGFAQAFVLHEASRFLSAVNDAITAHADDPRAALAAGVEVFLKSAEQDPLIAAIVSGRGDEGLLPLLTNQAGPVLTFATEQLTEVLTTTWPDVPDDAVRMVAENVTRLAISHAATATAPAEQTAAQLADLFGPYLDCVVKRR
ncbi:TetR/AcrR family transcriptional regulator [Thermocrispum municipale]|uniref:TetR/AcrR family transcriptional regulator n=1 Tax=Thermocrispum municipale TaxID=37926 RepID=UPI00048D0722|nr:TetR family transcriptional regulator [Thermocrispum municipale]